MEIRTMTKKPKATKSSKSAPKAKGPARGPVRQFSIPKSEQGTVKQRVAALTEAPLDLCKSDKNLQVALKILRSKDEPVKVRLAALQSLQAATFSVVEFASCRTDYVATLREIAEDPDPELRQRVLGILARDK